MKPEYRYEVILYWSEPDQAFIAEVPELPGCAADGPTYQAALEAAEVVIREWIETARELGSCGGSGPDVLVLTLSRIPQESDLRSAICDWFSDEPWRVRFRSVGDISCTCPVASSASSVQEILEETKNATLTERGATRMDDQTSEASMERRKKEGYF